MGLEKLKNEKKLIRFFIVASFIIFITSAVFLFLSIQKDELGGSFISAMLLFISGYGICVFLARMRKYKLAAQVQDAILNEGLFLVEEISQHLKRNMKKTESQVKFLVDNGYLNGYKLMGGEIINEAAEKEKINAFKDSVGKKQAATEATTEKKAVKRKSIQSEKCPNCGAVVQFKDGKATCGYCGNLLNKE